MSFVHLIDEQEMHLCLDGCGVQQYVIALNPNILGVWLEISIWLHSL